MVLLEVFTVPPSGSVMVKSVGTRAMRSTPVVSVASGFVAVICQDPFSPMDREVASCENVTSRAALADELRATSRIIRDRQV